MTFLQTFRECSILLPGFDEPVRNFAKIQKRVKRVADASKIVDFIGRAPTLTHFNNLCDTIKQIRVFVGSILQPEMKLLENRPRPP